MKRSVEALLLAAAGGCVGGAMVLWVVERRLRKPLQISHQALAQAICDMRRAAQGKS